MRPDGTEIVSFIYSFFSFLIKKFKILSIDLI